MRGEAGKRRVAQMDTSPIFEVEMLAIEAIVHVPLTLLLLFFLGHLFFPFLLLLLLLDPQSSMLCCKI